LILVQESATLPPSVEFDFLRTQPAVKLKSDPIQSIRVCDSFMMLSLAFVAVCSGLVFSTPANVSWAEDSLDMTTLSPLNPFLPRPMRVAFCETIDDVQTALKLRPPNETLSIRAGRHSYTEFSLSQYVVDVSGLRTLQFDSQTGLCTVGAGVRNFELFDFLSSHDRMTPGGTAPSVGIGYALGGGYSFVSRALGVKICFFFLFFFFCC
jgi:hypothetical protein